MAGKVRQRHLDALSVIVEAIRTETESRVKTVDKAKENKEENKIPTVSDLLKRGDTSKKDAKRLLGIVPKIKDVHFEGGKGDLVEAGIINPEEAQEIKAAAMRMFRRMIFREKNQVWIDFLNNPIPKEDITEWEASDVFLHRFHTQYTQAMYPEAYNHRLEDEFRFASVTELVSSCKAYMYDNFKAISRGERIEFAYVGKFRNHAQQIIFDYADRKKLFLSPSEGTGYFRLDLQDLKIPAIADIMIKAFKAFMDYMNDLYFGKAEYKIGVCRYQKRKLPECGKVFIGAKKTSEVCQEHERKWSYLKANKKRVKKQHK